MYPKNVDQIGAWTFSLLTPEGVESMVPPAGSFSTLTELTQAVVAIINIYDEATEGKYSQKQRAFALSQGLEFTDFIRSAIQHQLCLRNKGSIACWNDGLGDKLHEAAGKVDAFIDKTFTGKLKQRIQTFVMAVTPSHTPTLSGCSTCGGTTTFDPNADNSGRAGKVSRATRTTTKGRRTK